MSVKAMTTVSGVVVLYSPRTELASISVLNMDDTGELASAAATAMIVYTNVGVRGLHAGLARWLERRTQVCGDAGNRWRRSMCDLGPGGDAA